MLAPAKINLALHVTGRRADGYHLLDSLVVFTRFGDRLTITPSEVDGFDIAGPYGEFLPADETNLVLRALATMRAETGRDDPVHIQLEKNLPVASGVGGGSSDAAATFRALNDLWAAGLSPHRMAAIAAPLGADMPMCLAASPLIAEGIGDELTFIHGMPQYPMVLVNPGIHVPTPAVFKALARADNMPMPPMPDRLDLDDLVLWLHATRNDLQAPAIAICPVIAECIAALDWEGAAFARMSGSGATCFGLFQTGNAAKRAALAIRKRQPDWFVAATRTLDAQDASA